MLEVGPLAVWCPCPGSSTKHPSTLYSRTGLVESGRRVFFWKGGDTKDSLTFWRRQKQVGVRRPKIEYVPNSHCHAYCCCRLTEDEGLLTQYNRVMGLGDIFYLAAVVVLSLVLTALRCRRFVLQIRRTREAFSRLRSASGPTLGPAPGPASESGAGLLSPPEGAREADRDGLNLSVAEFVLTRADERSSAAERAASRPGGAMESVEIQQADDFEAGRRPL